MARLWQLKLFDALIRLLIDRLIEDILEEKQGDELCHFMSRRLNAYSNIIDDFGHCEDLEEVWRLETGFDQQTLMQVSARPWKLALASGASN